MLGLDELAVTIAALRVVDQNELAERLETILRHVKPGAPKHQPQES